MSVLLLYIFITLYNEKVTKQRLLFINSIKSGMHWGLNDTSLMSQHFLSIQLRSERCQITKVTTSVTLEVEHYVSNYMHMNLLVGDVIYMASLDLV